MSDKRASLIAAGLLAIAGIVGATFVATGDSGNATAASRGSAPGPCAKSASRQVAQPTAAQLAALGSTSCRSRRAPRASISSRRRSRSRPA